MVKYKPLLDLAIEMSPHKPDACLILQREQAIAPLTTGPRPRSAARPRPPPRRAIACPCWPPTRCTFFTPPEPPGRPKGVVRDNGGHAVALWNSMKMIYGCDAGDVYWAASDVGWVVGHSYIVYAPLLRGCTSIMYEGKPVGTPDAGAFWRVCAQHKVKVLFTAPTAMRAIKQQDPEGKLAAALRPVEAGGAVSRRRALRSADRRLGARAAEHAGGRSLVADRNRLGDHLRASASIGLFPFRPGSGGRPCPGYDLHALDDEGKCCRRARPATCRIRLPLPPGCGPTLWQNDDGYRNVLSGRLSRAGIAPATPAWWTRRATSGSWAAPTTSSTSPAIGCRPARWRKCWPRTRTSRNALSSARRTN